MTVEQITCVTGGTKHFHRSVYEAKVFHGLIRPPAPPTPPPPPAYEPPSQKQLDYVVTLNGDLDRARKMSKRECSKYIDELKRRPKVVTTDPDAVPTETVEATTKSKMVDGLIGMVPDGYFAVREQDGAPITFMRLSRPSSRNFPKGSIKVQSLHGPALETRWVKWPSGKISVYRWYGHDIEDYLLLLIADWRGASLLYAEKIRKCGRCNAKLTDPRSRFYGIGPECETKTGWTWWLDEIAEKKGGYWEQQPAHVQERYRLELENE
jgi:hypothetical protein